MKTSGFSFSQVYSKAQTGAGACPEFFIPSIAVEVGSDSMNSESIRTRLLTLKTPVAAYVAKEKVFIDLRSLLPADDLDLIDALLGLVIY